MYNVPKCFTDGGPQDFQEIVADLASDLQHPHLYEERHTYLRTGFALTMAVTRRLLWWQAMAGGMGGFYGFFAERKNSSQHPYPKPEQLRTHYRFWHTDGRFSLDMVPILEAQDYLDCVMLKANKRFCIRRMWRAWQSI